MKKFLALLLASLMLFGLVACNKDKAKAPQDEPKVEAPADTDSAEPADADVEEPADADEDVVEEEVVEEEVVEEDVDEDTDEVELEDEDFTGENAEENLGYEDPKFYTLNDSNYTTPSNWSPFTWETDNDSLVANWTTSSFYFFDYAEDSLTEGYEIGLDMAAELPEDITKEYAGDEKWGVPEDAEAGYVYRIKLLDYLMWDDGSPIKAQDFVYSLKELLDPRATSASFCRLSLNLKLI